MTILSAVGLRSRPGLQSLGLQSMTLQSMMLRSRRALRREKCERLQLVLLLLLLLQWVVGLHARRGLCLGSCRTDSIRLQGIQVSRTTASEGLNTVAPAQ